MSAFKDMLHEQYTNGGELKQDQGGISIYTTPHTTLILLQLSAIC